MLAIDVITRIATGMNKPFEKYCRVLVLPLTNVLADQKANVRASTVAALSAIATACEGLEPMVHPIASSLEATNPLQRSSLLTWVADWMKEHPAAISLDLSPWAGPVVLCLDDRNADVRKAAQAALPAVIAHAGYDYVVNQTSSMKAASRQSVLPLILAAKPVAGAVPVQIPASTTGFKTQISTPASAATPTSAEAETVPSAPKRKIPGAATGVRSKMPSRPESRADVSEPEEVATKKPAAQGFGLKRPVASTKPAPPFTGRNADAKKARLAKDGNRWVFEALPNRKDLFDVLQHQMEPHVSTELVSLLFSHDHNAVNDHITGLGIICDCYAQTVAGLEPYNLTAEEMKATLSATSDLPLKFVSLKIHEPQPNLIAKCLDTLENVLALLSDVNYQLTEAEAMCFVPTLINKVSS
jgi:cytoskeleton-associated protein 5